MYVSNICTLFAIPRACYEHYSLGMSRTSCVHVVKCGRGSMTCGDVSNLNSYIGFYVLSKRFGTPVRKIKHGLFYKCRRAKNNNFKKQI